jgi:hypothetical protein
MQCPNCKLENPIESLRCNCGYDFGTRTAATHNRALGLTVKELLGIESCLNLSFYAAVIAFIFLYSISWFSLPFLLEPRSNKTIALLLVIVAGAILAFAGYIWYMVSIYKTAKAINKPGGLYLLWAIGGPILSQIPIPIVSIALAVTPLIIKFLLSGEIRTMIRLRTLRDFH